MFVAGEQEIGAIPNLKSQPNSASWFSTNLGGTVSQVRTVVFGGGRVFFGGASGSIFVTCVIFFFSENLMRYFGRPTSNRELLSGQIRTYTRGMGNVSYFVSVPVHETEVTPCHSADPLPCFWLVQKQIIHWQ